MSSDVEGAVCECEESGSEPEELEPRLKYERIGNDLKNILQRSSASCIAVNTKFLCLGSHFGRLHILDHMGNNVQSKEVQAHAVTVNQISIDSSGDYIATCSDDGKVLIYGLYSTDYAHNLSFSRAVKSVAIEPDYYKPGSGRKFLTGCEKLILHEKSLLRGWKYTELHGGEGPIQNIKWRNRFVAWASSSGVRVFDMHSRRVISLIKRDHDVSLSPEVYKCCLCWSDDMTLLIAWANTIKMCVVKRRPLDEKMQDLPSHYVEIVYMFSTEFYCCGIGPLGDNIVVLSISKEEDDDSVVKPQLRVLEPHPEEYVELSNDILSIRNHGKCKPSDYYLECLVDEGLFFIVSPKDVIVAKPTDEDDHIDWLIRTKKWEAALAAVAVASALRRHTIQNVGQAYLNFLLSEGKYEEASRLCVKILKNDKELWEEEVYKFARLNQLRTLSPYLPTGDFKLSPAIYEMVLFEFLKIDQEGFLKTVKMWSSNMYSVAAVTNAVLEALLHDTENTLLLQALGILYTHERKFEKALSIYLKLGNQETFDLIHRHGLISCVERHLLELMELDSSRSVRLCLENCDQIAPDVVVDKLSNNRTYVFQYLDSLYRRDPEGSGKFHGLLVELFAEFAPQKLLPFLQSSSSYPLPDALKVCQDHKRIHESIYLLGRMGETHRALQLITGELGDLHRAIEFCKEYDDMALWKDLITYSLDKPEFIVTLLHNIGTHIDPKELIDKIPKGLKIPGLRDALVKILQDYNLQVSLQEGCQVILQSDCHSLLKKFLKNQHRAVSIEVEDTCAACQRRVVGKKRGHVQRNLLIFKCGHTFHEECCPIQNERCCRCYPQDYSPLALPTALDVQHQG